MTHLENASVFPDLALPTVGGGTLSLPLDLHGSYAVVLVYRGSWCPYCGGQLRAFARAADQLAEHGIQVVALSVDDESTSAAFAEKLGVTFPVAHSADAHAVAATLGSYVNEDPLFLQSTGFVLDPSGRIVTAVYSSGAIGRLVPEDVIGLVGYLKKSADEDSAR